MHTIYPTFYKNEEEICWGMGYTSVRPVLGRWTTFLWSVGALACPTFGFYARPQVPLARTRAVGPRVRDLYVGVAPDLCISGRCPSMLLAINRNSPHEILILEPHPFRCWVFQA